MSVLRPKSLESVFFLSFSGTTSRTQGAKGIQRACSVLGILNGNNYRISQADELGDERLWVEPKSFLLNPQILFGA